MLLAVGAGHMEKKLLLAIFRFCRKLFVETKAYKLGFRSKKAIEFIVDCGNHHISWQMCSIIYEAFSEELLYIYKKNCLERNIEPDPTHFTVWRDTEVKNNNYHLYYEIIFNILLGMKCFRSEIWQNNSLFALAGRQKVTPIMIINNHVIYRDLIRSTKEIKTFISRNESYSRSGDPSKGEGGDYVTKNDNRYLKSHLSPGVPSLKNW